MSYWERGSFNSSGSAPPPPERHKRSRTEHHYPAPPNAWKPERPDGIIAREAPPAAPAAFYAGVPQGTAWGDRHRADGNSGRRPAEAGEREKKPAPAHPEGQPSTGDGKGRNREETGRTPTAEQRPPPAENRCSHAALQELLRRIIALEFSGRCTQRSMAVVEAICDTLCHTPVAVVKVMEVLDECFAEAVQLKQQQQLLNYWYIVDAVMKLFRDRPSMLNAVVVALPHLLLQYVPWKKSRLAEESWMQRESDEHRYEQLFLTWGRAVPKPLLDEIWSMWKNGALPTETPTLDRH
ncbi:uncharacterized protein Tco025E_08912 [Trypanosoma conorhini]|uniref:Uncharacterized protein n=1 Tax=Trypanosoma conorhini TaxID=83891 RepID=A0A3S5IQF6_9TRYP|nr:uncharacterized protein Tco025E_08912 [Trypanosoma conorhini]RNE99887.1 hypothetical protein Tco025E_08912 [Trypanosoma conorhini]